MYHGFEGRIAYPCVCRRSPGGTCGSCTHRLCAVVTDRVVVVVFVDVGVAGPGSCGGCRRGRVDYYARWRTRSVRGGVGEGRSRVRTVPAGQGGGHEEDYSRLRQCAGEGRRAVGTRAGVWVGVGGGGEGKGVEN